jgi:hypothetical protein
MKRILNSSLSALLFVLASSLALAGQTPDPDQVYKNNCGRCHTQIQQYSPRMTKTLLMHMRVRANLPGDEVRAVLEYLNGKSEPVGASARQPKPAGNENQHK